MDYSKIFIGHAENLLERSKTKALLGDMLKNDMTQVYALMSAYDLDIVTLVEEKGSLDAFEKSALTDRLVKRFSMIERTAEWSIDTWDKILTTKLIKELADKKASILKEKEQQAMEMLSEPEEPLEDKLNEGQPKDYSNYKTAFVSRDDISDYYLNVSFKKKEGKIFVPCGFGNTDNGFFICGISESDHPTTTSTGNIYALVYNYLTRNSRMTVKDVPKYFETVHTPFQIDYQKIFRLSIIVLQMIKNNFFYSNGALNINYPNMDEINLAIGLINNYSKLFAHLVGVNNPSLRISPNQKAINISVDSKIDGIYIEENNIPCNAREIWFGQKITYRLEEEKHLKDLEYLLSEISDFEYFKGGQFEALRSMLSTNEHSICIMPTGSGKSLIFYMASLLQPLPMFILSPTDILIEDQIRNLKKFHHIDNVSHLKLTESNDFSNFNIYNSLIYLTPTTFQNRNLLVKCRHINNGMELGGFHNKRISTGAQISYVVLDEIHCLSNWGHDFRPEYLMVSHFLQKFLDKTTFLGFTATANYTVVQDIQRQLNIPEKNIFSPIELRKDNISYDFRAMENTDEMYNEIAKIANELVAKNERTIIFTKNDEIAFKVADRIGYEADVFQRDNTSAYHLFADGNCKMLVASEELGIGINLPDIQNIIHFGLPVSKNEYVQEIGRAGRAEERVKSYIIFLKPTENNVFQELLKREIDIPDLTKILDQMANDYSDCYRKLNNRLDSKDDLINNLMDLKGELSRCLVVKRCPIDGIEHVKRHIYMLYVLGYIKDWYSYSADEKDGIIEIMMSITNNDDEFNDSFIFSRMKKTAVEYYNFLGENRQQIAQTQRSNTIDEIIEIYVNWYYAKFLYHHKELFLDFLEFVEENESKNDDAITEEIKEYFTLPFIEIKEDEAKYRNMSLADITKKVMQGVDVGTIANIERLNSNSYSYSMDCFILLANLRKYSKFDEYRFERVISRTSHNMIDSLLFSIAKVYEKSTVEARFNTIKILEKYAKSFSLTVPQICDYLYKNIGKDIIYFGLLATECNKAIEKLGG